MRNLLSNGYSSISTKEHLSLSSKSSKKETSSTYPQYMSQSGRSSPKNGDEKSRKTPASNKRTSGFSKGSVPKRITRTLSKLSFKSPSSRYSKLSGSSDQSVFQENSGASCGLQENRKTPASSAQNSSARLKQSSTSKKSQVQGGKGSTSRKSSSSVDRVALQTQSSSSELSSEIDAQSSIAVEANLDDTPMSSRQTSSRSKSVKYATNQTSKAHRSIARSLSESASSSRSSTSLKTGSAKSSTSKQHLVASKRRSTLKTAVSLNTTDIPKSRTCSKHCPTRKQLSASKRPPKMSSGSVDSEKRGLAMIGGDRAKAGHSKMKALTAARTGIPRRESHALNASSSNHRVSAEQNVRRVHVHHHHIVVPAALRDQVAHRRPASRPPPEVLCQFCRCDIQATVYSRLGCCFDCGSQHGYCSVSSDDCW